MEDVGEIGEFTGWQPVRLAVLEGGENGVEA
jgi:hypothetical protein